ncbi:hypothetical protein [uncultured Roseibium sp.]|uniref:hypothetical protein n=1 Tax=uncultured Roseibium sp. TaxID=1936171 RepID=UPI00260EFF2A|nr:hypothetical protein [uncultured Roseibium sp.]
MSSNRVWNHDPSYAYVSPGHRQFNKSLEPKVPYYDVVNAPWMSNETLNNLPKVHFDFNISSDPANAEQLQHLEKTEAQRREDVKRSGKEQLKLELKPPRHMRQAEETPFLPSLYPVELEPSDAQQNEPAPGKTWLEQERDRVMAQIPQAHAPEEPSHEINPSYSHPEPSR